MASLHIRHSCLSDGLDPFFSVCHKKKNGSATFWAYVQESSGETSLSFMQYTNSFEWINMIFKAKHQDMKVRSIKQSGTVLS